MNWKSLLTPFTDKEIREIQTGMGPMRVLDVERIGDFVVFHGRHVINHNPISASFKESEVPAAAE